MAYLHMNRPLPDPEAADALHAALKTALGSTFAGIVTEDDGIRLIFEDAPTAEQANIAQQVILKHDFSERTPDQTRRAQRRQRLADARMSVTAAKAVPAGDANRIKHLESQVEYLMLEMEHLRDSLGL